MKIYIIRIYSRSLGTVEIARTAYRTKYGAERELRASGYHDAGQDKWETEKLIAAISEVELQ